jgi:hypothetical protein
MRGSSGHDPLTRSAALLLPLLATLGCAIAPLRTTGGGTQYAPKVLAPKASFDHRCPIEQVVLVRGTGWNDTLSTWDLEICGKVRRYECLHMPKQDFACRDRTGEYPDASLPAASGATTPSAASGR